MYIHMHTIVYYNVLVRHQYNDIRENHGHIAWWSGIDLELMCNRINSNLTAGHYGHEDTLKCVQNSCILYLFRISLLLVCTVCKYRSMYISIEHTTYILALYYCISYNMCHTVWLTWPLNCCTYVWMHSAMNHSDTRLQFLNCTLQ